MGEQGVVLEDGVDRATVGGNALDVLAANEDRPFAWLLEAGDHAQRRRLAAAAGADERKELAIADL